MDSSEPDYSKFDMDFTPFVTVKRTELEAIAAYIGKDESRKTLTSALQELSPELSSTAMIKDPYDYIVLVAKLIERRKVLTNSRNRLEILLQDLLAKLREKLGDEQVSDRLAAWLAKYNSRTSAQIETASQIANIAVIEKLLEGMRGLL